MRCKKAQQTILGAVLVTGIVILLIFVAFVWGRPLIQKNLDMSRILGLIKTMEEVDSSIRYVAESGATKSVEISLENSVLKILPDEILEGNDIQVDAQTLMPIVSYVTWVPLNTDDTPYSKEKFRAPLSSTDQTIPCVTGVTSTKRATLSMYGYSYEIFVFETPDYGCDKFVCIKKPNEDPALVSCEESCKCEGGIVQKDGIQYKINYVGGESVEIAGALEENIGTLGIDKQGIILGMATRAGDQNRNSIRLVYRGVEDELSKTVHRIDIECATPARGCVVGEGEYLLEFSLISRERKPNEIESKIKMNIVRKGAA